MTENLNKTIADVWAHDYVVPLYQRNYAWGEDEIGQLLQDIYDYTPINNGLSAAYNNYYLGSLVVMRRRDDTLEVIDGQQRLTTLHLLCRYLNILKSPKLTFDSRPQVERFLDELFGGESWENFYARYSDTDNNKLVNLVAALHHIAHYRIKTSEEGDTTSLTEMSDSDKASFAKYLADNVVLVITPLPEDTDVAAYFEIMNNRGEQLKPHEVVKSLMMRKLSSAQRNMFANIWDACSQMNVPIQKSLGALRSAGLFGLEYNALDLTKVRVEDQGGELNENDKSKHEKGLSISEILTKKDNSINHNNNINDTDEFGNYNAIVNFPNFLMLAFRIYEAKVEGSETTPLNADLMKFEQPDFIKNPMDFMEDLLKLRVLFDRYVIKIQGDEDGEDDYSGSAQDGSVDLKWQLIQPYRYYDQKRNTSSLRWKNTFSGIEVNDDAVDDNKGQNRVVKQQSMLRVTFRQKNKDWLYRLLSFLMAQSGSGIEVTANDVVTMLDRYIAGYAENLFDKWQQENADIFNAGVNTPHFLLNYIDYLYWLAWIDKNTVMGEVLMVEDFTFKYLNTVEHHYPQDSQSLPKIDNVDSIGNLCLMSRRKNASLNNRDPLEKANRVDNKCLQPKRRVMYEITKFEASQARSWNVDCINAHANNVLKLISEAKNLLAL